MEKLLKFFENFNSIPFSLPNDELKVQLLDEMTAIYRETLKSQYLEEDNYTSGVFGCSQLGKPAICTAWDYFYPPEEPPLPTCAQKRKWFGGHEFETHVYFYARRLGYELRHQQDVKVSDLIKGHPDFIAEGDNSKFIIECKHVDDVRYKQYKKYGMKNQQYITQLALYCVALELSGVWVIGNACTGEMIAIPLTLDTIFSQYMDFVTRSHVVSALCIGSETLVDVLKKGIAPPKPKQRRDGTFYIIPEMYVGKGKLHPSCFLYDFEVRDEKYYVNGLSYPEEAKGSEPEWAKELWS